MEVGSEVRGVGVGGGEGCGANRIDYSFISLF